jgi:hypothetical protein
MYLELVEKMSKKQLREHINTLFAEAQNPGLDRSSRYSQAQFYMRELEHRHDSWISLRDLLLEIVVILLIGGEILLGYCQGSDEAKAAALQYQVLTTLQTSSGATADRLVEAKNALKTLNDKLQAEIDLYYEPSITLEYFQQFGFHRMRVSNNGRTRISIFGVKGGRPPRKNSPCELGEPLSIPSAGSNVMDSGLINIFGVQSIIDGGGTSKVSVYFRTENGKEYEHQVLVERVPIVEGKTVFISHQNTIPIAWTPELKGALAGKCTE